MRYRSEVKPLTPLSFVIESVCAGFFTVDYIVRLCSSPCWYKWIFRTHLNESRCCPDARAEPFPIIDFVSTVPYYVELIVDVRVPITLLA